jgi:GTP-dependent phosphoenolpyruvate carboxykinase
MMMMDDIWVYFEVDSHTAGQVWNVTLTDNGSVFWRGTRTTNRSGDFGVHDWTHDRSGADQIVAKGVNRATGEVCRGAGSV